ncbi:unnamed protein product, partial [Mesorhabditis spiculigera]
MCNNYAYILMLSAAEDIIEKNHKDDDMGNGTNLTCPLERGTKHCSNRQSTGFILLADVLPSFIIMAIAPFFAHKISFGLRHFLVVLSQSAGLLIVDYSESYWIAILGVVLASLSCGLGESTLVSYSCHFPHSTVVAWASGTGGAGVIGSFIYAALTEPQLFGLSPKDALLVMQVGLLKYIIPLVLVYFAEYTINQGLTQLIVFDCGHAFGLTKHSQYRWYQVLYRAGVFISRSSMAIVKLPVYVLYVLPVLQLGNTVFFYFEAIHAYLPHIAIAFTIIFFEGLFGGSAYVKTLNHIHKTADPSVREFSLGVGTCSDTIGILFASFSAIFLHNHICDLLG